MKDEIANRIAYLGFLVAFIVSSIGYYASGEALGAVALGLWSVFWFSMRWTWPTAWNIWWHGKRAHFPRTTAWVILVIAYILAVADRTLPLLIVVVWLAVLIELYFLWVSPGLRRNRADRPMPLGMII